MQNRKPQTKKWVGPLLLIVTVVCFGLTAAVPGETACKTYRLEVPDPADLKLKDGEQVIASTPTGNGSLEARVTVRGGVSSNPRFYIGGKLFEKTTESNVPADVRECLKSAQRAQSATSSYGDLRGSLASPALSWVANTVYSKTKCVVLSSGCGQRACYATVCCEVNGFAECAFHMTHIVGAT